MYHTMYPPPMMVQVVGSQQINGQYSTPTQTHVPHTNNTRQTEYTQYPSVISGNNRHRYFQPRSYPPELFPMLGLDVPPLRRTGYNMQNRGGSMGNWQRRGSPQSNDSTIPPPPQLSVRPNNGPGSYKKQNWNNKQGKRNIYRDPLPPKEGYNSNNSNNNNNNNSRSNSDSGFSSRSPTPNKHPADNSLNESSNERVTDSSSSVDQGTKRLHEQYQNSAVVSSSNASQGGLSTGRTSQQHFYQNRALNPYHNSENPQRTPLQNYQGKKRFLAGKTSPPSQRTQKGRRYSGPVVPNYSMLPRSVIAPDRYLARSHLIQVDSTPSDLYGSTVWNDLSREIWTKFLANQQTETTYKNKMGLWKFLYVAIKKSFPRYGLFLVGSTMNGFGSDNSDVDLCLIVKNTETLYRSESIGVLQLIQKSLRDCSFIGHLDLIKAKVPILKFHDLTRNLDVDLNCNNAVGIRNTHLLYCYSRIDWRVRPLVVVVKLWAQCQDINDAKNMTISSYSLVLMVIHFLQCGVSPSILPCLHAIYPSKFNPSSDIHGIDMNEELRLDMSPLNRQPLGELLYEFLKYYAAFDYGTYAISVRLSRKVPIQDCRRVISYKNDPNEWKCLCIEEPFDLTNTARSVYDIVQFYRIRQIFVNSYQRLKANGDLSSIFVKTIPRVNHVHYTH